MQFLSQMKYIFVCCKSIEKKSKPNFRNKYFQNTFLQDMHSYLKKYIENFAYRHPYPRAPTRKRN